MVRIILKLILAKHFGYRCEKLNPIQLIPKVAAVLRAVTLAILYAILLRDFGEQQSRELMLQFCLQQNGCKAGIVPEIPVR